MLAHFRTNLRSLLGAAVRIYFLFLFAWFAFFLLLGDASGFLGLLNAVAIWFFLPLPLVLLFIPYTRQNKLWMPAFVAALGFFLLWGQLLLPKSNSSPPAESLKVMSFNILGRAGEIQPILDTIRAEELDLLFVQELTPEAAAILSVQLAGAFPYQILEPDERARGMGVFSRYPLKQTDIALAGIWMGRPQVLSMDWQGSSVTLVNFHTVATGTLWPRWVRHSFENREQALQHLADFVAAQAEFEPVIVAGDANITALNDAYKTLTTVMTDSWVEAGQGLGHTFPGPISEGNDYAQISFFRVPYWLVRIDYIFHTQQWATVAIRLADFNGGTDHRGIIAEFVLVE